VKKKRQNTIEINGKIYDAASGLPVENSAAAKPKVITKQASAISLKKARPQGPSINGFVGTPKSIARPTKVISQKHRVAVSSVAKKPASTPAAAKSFHRQPASNIGRRAKSSVTLNRSGVHKPAIDTAKAAENTSPHVFTSASKLADINRMNRLQNIHKSESVSRFSKKKEASNSTPVASRPVSHVAPETLTQRLSKTHDKLTSTTQITKKEQFIKNTLAKTAVHESASLAADKATKKLRKKTNKNRVGSYATAGLLALLITGYVAYLNIPSISMKVAANRAGFAAAMPGYQPSGYRLNGPIAYSPGQVTVNFASNTDDRKFSLRQQPTTWDSNALLENYVTKQSGDYLTYQDQGLSIYIFNGTSAAWVNGQKMYIIEGDNSQLDTDQILKLATSV